MASEASWYQVKSAPLVPSLREFGEQHGLRMEVIQRSTVRGEALSFYAHFYGLEVLERSATLVSVSGNGTTPQEAVDDYEMQIAGKLCIMNAMSPSKRGEIYAPSRFSPEAHHTPEDRG